MSTDTDDDMPPALRQIWDAVDDAAPPDDIPIVPLGTVAGDKEGKYAFLDRGGELKILKYNQVGTRSGIDHLFGGINEWLIDRHPQKDEKGRVVKDEWSYDSARSDLYRRCAACGPIDVGRAARSTGAWRDVDGSLILHCGDRVRIQGEWRPSGFRYGRHFYPSAEAIPSPAPRAATAEECAELLDLLRCWEFRTPAAPLLLLGFFGSAPICGALRWRPHIWVTGLPAMGKSTLEQFMFSLFGAALYRASAPSEASVRQGLDGRAMPTSLDEIEFQAGSTHAREVLDLAKLGSTDLQAPKTRGSLGGGVVNYFIRACFYFTSTLHAPLRPADKTRVTVIKLERLSSAVNAAALRARLDRMSKLGPALFARMVDGWDRFNANLIVFEQAMGEKKMSARQADQFGTLLAASETLLSDSVASPQRARAVLAEFEGADEIEDTSGHDGPMSCLNRLSSFPADLWRSGERVSHGELIAQAIKNPNGETAAKLKTLGLQLWPVKGAPKYVAVAHQHENIRRVFDGTDWADGVWSQMLGWLEGAPRGRASEVTPTVYFGPGARSRADLVPIEFFIDDATATAEGAPAAGGTEGEEGWEGLEPK